MVPQSPRHVPSARQRRIMMSVRPQCELLEDRITPALFNVLNPLSFTGLNNNGCVATADLNQDGLSDAVLPNFGTDYGSGAGSTITVLYAKPGVATNGFSRITLNSGGTNPSFVATGDINGDGYPDVVVANENGQNTGSFSVFKNDGAGDLSLVGTYSTFSNNPSWIGLADVTGDGILDVVVGSFGKDDGTGNNVVGNNITIFQGNADAQGHGNFTFSTNPITTLAPDISFIPAALAIADFNGDGIQDIAAAVPGVPADSTSPQPDGSVWVFQGTGSGGFSAPNQYDSGGALPLNIQAADLNGDNKPDLVVANAGDPNASPEFNNNSVGVLLNVSSNSSVNFGITNSLTANCHGTFAVAVADFNLDGKADIAAVNYGAEFGSSPAAFVSVYMGTGSGTFTPGSPGTYDTKTNSGGGQYLAVGDFDGNGTPDLIVAHASNLVGVLLNTSTGQAATTTTLSSSLNPSTAGQSVTFTATESASSGTPSGGSVTFFDNGTQIGSPVNLDANQQASITTTLTVAGTHTITATYSGASGFAGSSGTLSGGQVVTAGPATTFSFSGLPSTATAGVSFNFTLTARDQYGNVAKNYTGTVHFTSSDGQASLPADYTFVGGDNGTHTFTATLKTAGSQSLTATDAATSSITGSQSGITVNAAAAATLSVSGYPSSTVAGVAHTFTVTAKDAFGNTAASYGGTVHFTSSDGQASLPADYTFVGGDNGTHTFTATLKTAGSQSLTATDAATSSITGSQSGITVTNPSPPPPISLAAVGNGTGNVVVFNSNTGTKYLQFRPFNTPNSPYIGQISIALGDVNGDGVADLIIATRGKRAGKIKVFDGAGIIAGTVTQPTQTLLVAFPLSPNGKAADNGYKQGLTVAAADVNGDGIDDIAVASRTATSSTTGALLPATVVVYAGATGRLSGNILGSFRPIGTATDGLYVAAGDLTGDGKAEVVVSSSNHAMVKIYSQTNGNFTQLGSTLGDGGALVPTSGDGQVCAFPVNGSSSVDIITGSLDTLTGASDLQVFDGSGNQLATYHVGSGASFFALDTIDLNQDGNSEVMLALVTPSGGPTIDLLNPMTGAIVGTLNGFLNLSGKVTVGGF
jgi:Bacterial Ig-like domain (group 3)/FG-GAP-like repeat/FG-GAP repeat